jgi:hypothetical protein
MAKSSEGAMLAALSKHVFLSGHSEDMLAQSCKHGTHNFSSIDNLQRFWAVLRPIRYRSVDVRGIFVHML